MKIHLFHNIISPYKTLLFNELNNILYGNLKVVYFTNTASERDWNVDKNKIEFDYEVLNDVKLEDLSQILLAKQVFKYLLKHKPKVVVVGGYDLLAFWVVWLWRVFFSIKLACIMESQEQDHKRSCIKEFVKKMFFYFIDLNIAAGEKHRDYLLKLGVDENKVAVMNGVGGVEKTLYNKYLSKYNSIEERKLLYKKLNIPNINYFIYVGRFSSEKNIKFFLKAYCDVVKSFEKEEEWGIILVGSGKQESEIREFVSKLDIKNVIYPGFIQQNILPKYYLVSKVFVLPSISEPWGLVVDEAITLGLPVLISEKCGCVPDIVKNEINGLTFNPLDMNDLKNKIAKIINYEINLESLAQESLRISKKCSPLNSAEIIAKGLNKLNE